MTATDLRAIASRSSGCSCGACNDVRALLAHVKKLERGMKALRFIVDNAKRPIRLDLGKKR